VRPGSAIGLSAGTTTWTLAHRLLDVSGITVVTNSVQIATVFYQSPRPDQTVVLTGGVRTPSDALVGPVADAALAALHVDRAFLGVHGLDRDGLSTPNLLEAATDRALIAGADQAVVLADRSKWDVVGLARIAPLDAVDVLVTDDGLPDDARAVLAAAVGRLVLATPDPARRDAAAHVADTVTDPGAAT